MINTLFLEKQYDENDKSFSHKNVKSLANKRFSYEKQNILDRFSAQYLLNIPQFNVRVGKTYIDKVNSIHNLDYVPGNVDIILPKPEQIFNWVVLMFHSDQMIYDVHIDNFPRIKVHGNGHRIMGLDEPLLCDMPFSSLRFTYVNETDGWIIT